MDYKSRFSAIIMATLASILFGASAPLSKLLLGDIQPLHLASLLYLGCGLGVLIFMIGSKLFIRGASVEARLTRRDIPWLIGVVITGGVAAPIILMLGLQATPASTASLLLNFEAVSTAFIAALVFWESIGKRIWLSIALITVASIILTLSNTADWGLSFGALGILCACLLWGLENNLTRKISSKDPLTTTIIKGFGAGIVSLMLSLITGCTFPVLLPLLLAIVLGAFSYGISIVLFIYSMRKMGAARTCAFFGVAPFIGSIISVIIFGEIPTIQFFISLPLMIIGAILILNEKHGHMHIHECDENDHKHRHDDQHHDHIHEDGFSGEHAHPHVHNRLEHEHPHLPDIHHRHKHNRKTIL